MSFFSPHGARKFVAAERGIAKRQAAAHLRETSPAPAREFTIAVRVGASPDATAFAFGAMLHREYGKEWPRLLGIATGAAMRAERDTMGDV